MKTYVIPSNGERIADAWYNDDGTIHIDYFPVIAWRIIPEKVEPSFLDIEVEAYLDLRPVVVGVGDGFFFDDGRVVDGGEDDWSHVVLLPAGQLLDDTTAERIANAHKADTDKREARWAAREERYTVWTAENPNGTRADFITVDSAAA
jgi:hypothetical protein